MLLSLGLRYSVVEIIISHPVCRDHISEAQFSIEIMRI